MSIFAKLQEASYQWLDERLKISALNKVLSKKVVPLHENTISYYFGGIALFFFVLQIITGLLLMVYYQPGIETSYESVKYIIEKVAYGELIRSMHSWSANLMIGALFIHMFTAYFMKAYRKPREITWLTGFGLFMIALGLGFSGYLLTWDELAFFATKVGLQVMNQAPVVGSIMADLLRGGEDISNATIGRFFELHVVVFPLALMGLLGLHLLLVQLHGMSTPHSYTNKPEKFRKSIPFFSDFMFQDLFIWTIIMGGVVVLSLAHPWELGPKADPWAPAPEGIRPEWYFVFMFQILKMLPAHIGPIEGELFGILMFGVAGALWALVPFWESINKCTSKLATVYGVIALVVIVSTTSYVYWGQGEKAAASPPSSSSSISGSSVSTSNVDASKAESVFKQSCAACHTIGEGALVGPDLKGLSERREREQAADFIVNPAGSAMPKIEGIDKEMALALFDYIESQSVPPAEVPAETPKVQETPTAPPVEVSTLTEDVENGKKLFVGTKPFANGGSACIACHNVQGIGVLNGGTLGPDLTYAFSRLGESKGLEAWLGAIPSATMKPIYQDHSLKPEEIKALVAYLGNVDKSEAGAVEKSGKTGKTPVWRNKFFLFGFAGLFVFMIAIALLYSGRFHAVRKPLVEKYSHKKEND